ncbi:MAG TPA: hypothetical protein VK826_04530, partial [Bacteroidia bacterium]|nr:hypothetical protein [Bacteroidia bacterium]
MENNTDYTFERLNADNVARVPDLFNKVFGKRVSIEDVQKKYSAGYTGTNAVAVIAFDADHRAVGFNGRIPYRFRYQHEIVIGFQNCDAMVISESRKQNVFNRLDALATQAACNEGARFFFGFGNQNSAPVLAKQGWTIKEEEMKRFVIPTGAIPLGRIFTKMKSQRKRQHDVQRILTPYTVAYNGIFDKHTDDAIRVVYDDAYLAYKSLNPVYFLRIGSVFLLVKVDRFLNVGAISASTQEEMDASIGTLRQLGKEMGVSDILFQVKKDSVEDRLLSKNYNGVKSWPICVKDHSSQL